MKPMLSFSFMLSLMPCFMSSLVPVIVMVVMIVDRKRVKMLIGKQIVMKLPTNEDSLNRVGVYSNEKLADSV